MHSRQIKFIQDALSQKNAEKKIRKILELEFLDNINGTEIKKDGKLHSPVINGELIPAISQTDGLKAYYDNGKLQSFDHNGELIPAISQPNGIKDHYNDGKKHSFVHNGELIPSMFYLDEQKVYHNNGTKVDPAERMREIIAEKLLETKEDKLVAVLKLLA